ncbi:hypothetical protein FD07_GL000912 [Levilactobacillus parabrevis ATCC 53295]|uniref:Uncharacterized protein n=1 Tax=Levilactobacillus parabrevis ATCC 53295 TaxID=1267003 RepID=A0A0R1GR33_9LACO|nr:hypothetical protein FD07_GL000912 [Levilactobacillus parabrevis ATCC 53295]KRO05755.1 hypothetical protein IV61_GL000977 [Levilactobacillus parabrevis]
MAPAVAVVLIGVFQPIYSTGRLGDTRLGRGFEASPQTALWLRTVPTAAKSLIPAGGASLT